MRGLKFARRQRSALDWGWPTSGPYRLGPEICRLDGTFSPGSLVISDDNLGPPHRKGGVPSKPHG